MDGGRMRPARCQVERTSRKDAPPRLAEPRGTERNGGVGPHTGGLRGRYSWMLRSVEPAATEQRRRRSRSAREKHQQHEQDPSSTLTASSTRTTTASCKCIPLADSRHHLFSSAGAAILFEAGDLVVYLWRRFTTLGGNGFAVLGLVGGTSGDGRPPAPLGPARAAWASPRRGGAVVSRCIAESATWPWPCHGRQLAAPFLGAPLCCDRLAQRSWGSLWQPGAPRAADARGRSPWCESIAVFARNVPLR